MFRCEEQWEAAARPGLQSDMVTALRQSLRASPSVITLSRSGSTPTARSGARATASLKLILRHRMDDLVFVYAVASGARDWFNGAGQRDEH